MRKSSKTNGVALAHVYFVDESARRALVNRLSGADPKAVARAMAAQTVEVVGSIQAADDDHPNLMGAGPQRQPRRWSPLGTTSRPSFGFHKGQLCAKLTVR